MVLRALMSLDTLPVPALLVWRECTVKTYPMAPVSWVTVFHVKMVACVVVPVQPPEVSCVSALAPEDMVALDVKYHLSVCLHHALMVVAVTRQPEDCLTVHVQPHGRAPPVLKT